MSLNLAELVALIQDQLQNSSEFNEQMAVIGRDSGQSDLRVALSEAEIELPLSFETEEVGVDPNKMKDLIEKGSSIEIAKQLLKAPQISKEFVFALKDRMTIKKAEGLTAQVSDYDADKAEMKQTAAEIAKEKSTGNLSTLPEILQEIHAERVKKLDWSALEKGKFMTLKTATVKPDTVSADKPEITIGRISLKFKMTTN